MCFSPRKALHVIFCCALTLAVSFQAPESRAAPPLQKSKQQASSRVWANYARQMEPQRDSRTLSLPNEQISELAPISWAEALEEDSLMMPEQSLPSADMPGSCQGCLGGCCPSHQRSCQRWIQFDYLLGWRKGQRVPELVTTSIAGTPDPQAGILGLASTSIVLGNEDLVDGARPGGRIDFGRWLGNGETAIAGRFYAMSDSGTSHLFDGSTHEILARPYFDINSGIETASLVNYASGALATGSIEVTTGASLLGSDFYLRQSWCQVGRACVDLVTGYQFTRIDESLNIHSNSTHITQSGTATLELTDQFETRNSFHGGQMGLMSEAEGTCWSLTVLAKVGLGNTHQVVNVRGNRVITVPGGSPSTEARGLLAQDSNSGVHENNQFTVVPELNLRYTQHISECVDLSIGYSYIYWSNVVQPGSQVSRIIDDNPSGTQPLVNMVNDDYWMQSLNFGITWWF